MRTHVNRLSAIFAETLASAFSLKSTEESSVVRYVATMVGAVI
jgi:hypothetical protein